MPTRFFIAAAMLLFTAACFNPFARWEYTCQAPLVLGVACEADSDCVDGLICHPSNKVCADRLPAGSDCGTSSECAEGLACATNIAKFQCFSQECDASGQNCRVSAATGNACPDRQTCPGNQLCMLDTSSVTGICQSPASMGQSCEDFYEGAGCETGAVCLSNNLCGAPPALGEACPRGTERCPNNWVCFFNDDGSNTCELPKAIGQRCTAGGQCEKGAYCDLGRLVCTKNRIAGASCQNGNECGEAPFDEQIGVDCVRGRCVDTSKEGAECWPNRPSQCTNGRVCRRAVKT